MEIRQRFKVVETKGIFGLDGAEPKVTPFPTTVLPWYLRVVKISEEPCRIINAEDAFGRGERA